MIKKEPIIAIVVGIAIGIALAVAILQFTSKEKIADVKTPEKNSNATSLLTPDVEEELFTLISPLDGEEVATNSVELVLNIKKPALIILQGTASEKLHNALDVGKVSLELPLKNGVNQIQITALNKQQTSTKILRLFSK